MEKSISFSVQGSACSAGVRRHEPCPHRKGCDLENGGVCSRDGALALGDPSAWCQRGFQALQAPGWSCPHGPGLRSGAHTDQSPASRLLQESPCSAGDNCLPWGLFAQKTSVGVTVT